jgi:hypothetical protein
MRGVVSATLAPFTEKHRDPILTDQRSGRTSKPKYIVSVTAITNPLIDTMKPYIAKMIGSDVLGAKTLALVSVA